MGGGYYDRDVISSSGGGAGNDVVGKQSGLNAGLDPKTFTDEDNRIVSENLNPIIFALDVTGSMGEWPRIIYDKMPMFYGQVKMKDYLKDPAISFCAIGDAVTDQAPLQVTRFGQGKEIDEMIAKLWLQGNGGGNQHESYELSAYFYNNYVKMVGSHMAFYFVTGDEFYYDKPEISQYEAVLGVKVTGSINGEESWKKLMKTHNVFHLKKDYGGDINKDIYKQWTKALGKERVLEMVTPKACIDVILGAIAITSGVRNLKSYITDMQERGQSKDRIEEVVNALRPYAEKLEKGEIKPVIHQTDKPALELSQVQKPKPPTNPTITVPTKQEHPPSI